MQEAYIYDAVRTPRGKGKAGVGALNEVKPVALLGNLLGALESRHQLETALVEDVVMGCVTPVGDQGSNIAKSAVMYAGWDEKVSAFQMNRFCASGLEAVNLAASKVRSGWEQLVVAGGVESMSRVPMMSDGGAWAMDPETNLKTDFVPQGVGADLIATIEGFSRADVDAYAVESHRRAAHAHASGYFDKSRIAVTDASGRLILAHDELVRADASVETIGALKPSFAQMGAMGFDATALRKYNTLASIDHVHTPANSSGIVDGAAAVLIGSESIGADIGLRQRAKIISAAVISTDPTIMLTGPAPAARKALALAGLSADDIDLYEVNEAFASVVMRFQKDTQVPFDKINVNGGAIAMGHPLGATGAMILGTLLDELERQDKTLGLATLCVGGGMGIATIIERV